MIIFQQLPVGEYKADTFCLGFNTLSIGLDTFYLGFDIPSIGFDTLYSDFAVPNTGFDTFCFDFGLLKQKQGQPEVAPEVMDHLDGAAWVDSDDLG